MSENIVIVTRAENLEETREDERQRAFVDQEIQRRVQLATELENTRFDQETEALTSTLEQVKEEVDKIQEEIEKHIRWEITCKILQAM